MPYPRQKQNHAPYPSQPSPRLHASPFPHKSVPRTPPRAGLYIDIGAFPSERQATLRLASCSPTHSILSVLVTCRAGCPILAGLVLQGWVFRFPFFLSLQFLQRAASAPSLAMASLLTTHYSPPTFLPPLFHTFPQSHKTISIPPTPSILSTSARLNRVCPRRSNKHSVKEKLY